MIALLINVIILILVFGLLYWVITLIPLPPPFAQIAQVVLVVLLVIILISFLLGLVQPYGHGVLIR